MTDSQLVTTEGKVNRVVADKLQVSTAAGGLAFVNMSEVMEFAKLMSASNGSVPKHLRGSPGSCLGVILQAIEWEMSPFAVANKSYSVSDRLAYEAQLINAVILRRAPIKGRFGIGFSGEGDKRRCAVTASLRDGSGTVDYLSPEIGRIPVKNSPLWKHDPDQQLFYYASRALCRRHFPDVLLGIYSRDELEDSQPVKDVTPPPKRASMENELKAIASTPAMPVDEETGEISAGVSGLAPPQGHGDDGGGVLSGGVGDPTKTTAHLMREITNDIESKACTDDKGEPDGQDHTG